jgi:hypothetical protein
MTVVRKTFVLLVTLLCMAGATAALAQTNPGNGQGGGPGNGPGNGCGNGQSNGRNPNCPYPANSAIAVRDRNGNIVDGTHGLRVGDAMDIVSDGWQPNSTVSIDFLSTVIHLGDVAADASGVVRASFPVPAVEPGQHTLRLTGIGQDGQPRVVEYPILVLSDAQTSNVLGKTLTNAGGGSGSGGSGFFGKTGLDHALDIAGVGLALLAVGLVLTLAVRRSRRSATV